MLLLTLLATHLPPASASEGKKTVRGRIPQPLVLVSHHQLGGTKQHKFIHSSGGQQSKLSITGPKSRCWWGYSPTRGSIGESSLCLTGLVVLAVPMALSLQSLLPWPHYLLLLCLYSNLPLPPPYKDICDGTKGPP